MILEAEGVLLRSIVYSRKFVGVDVLITSSTENAVKRVSVL